MKTTRTESETIVRNHLIWATAAGLIPIPLLGIGAVTAIQLDMLKKLSNSYEQDYSESSGKAWVAALAGSTGARIGAEALKLIPGVGSVVGGITSAVLSGATTYAIGHVFIRHFENGGTIVDFSPSDYKAYYDEKFEEGKAEAKTARKQKLTKNVQAKLNKLADQFQRGEITKKEHDRLRDLVINL